MYICTFCIDREISIETLLVGNCALFLLLLLLLYVPLLFLCTGSTVCSKSFNGDRHKHYTMANNCHNI